MGISSAGWICHSKLGDWPLSIGGQIWRTGHSAEVANAGGGRQQLDNWPLSIMAMLELVVSCCD